MPEFLAPGVYFEETGNNPAPIPGIGASIIDDGTARALVAAMRPLVLGAYPDWTQADDSDPGVTLVQLLTFIAEGLLYRSDADADRRRRAILRAASDLSAVAGECATARAALRRLRYYSGRLLGAADLQLEQDYHREKFRRHNLNILGIGIVSGFAVAVDVDGEHVVVEPGYAIDRCGEELAIPVRLRLAAPKEGDALFVTLRYGEHPCDPVATEGNGASAGSIEEVCLLAMVGELPPEALAIARLVRSNGRWTTDASFVPLRIARP